MDSTKFNKIKEGKFEYIQEGKGAPLVLLHGLFGALSNFEKVIEHFKDNYQVTFLFLPLYDLSLPNSTVTGMVNYLDEFLQYKRLKNINILGNSLGGHVAQLYALQNIDNVNSIILTGSSGLFENSLGGGYPKRDNYEFVKQKTAYTFYNPKFATKELVDDVFETINNRNKAIRILTIAKSAIRQNLKNELSKLTMPVKLIWGKNDTITPPFVAEEFKQLLPNASLNFIEKCGHAAMMERPNTFNKILEEFLISIYKNSEL